LKSTNFAYALLLLVGIFGGHKFYLGNIKGGILYLSLFVGAGLLMKSIVGLILFVLFMILLLIDFVTLPAQIAKANGSAPH